MKFEHGISRKKIRGRTKEAVKEYGPNTATRKGEVDRLQRLTFAGAEGVEKHPVQQVREAEKKKDRQRARGVSDMVNRQRSQRDSKRNPRNRGEEGARNINWF